MEIPEIIIVPNKSIRDYAKKAERNWKSGTASEPTYYDDFKQFLESIFPPEKGYLVQSGFKIQGSKNKPDLTVSFNGIVLFHIEGKKPHTPIESMIQYDPDSRLYDQVQRYQSEGNQVLITDFFNVWLVNPPQKGGHSEKEPLSFQFQCKILEETPQKNLIPVKNAQHEFQELLTLTCAAHLQSISNAKKLIYPLADLAHRIREKTIFLLDSYTKNKAISGAEKKAASYLAQIKEDFAKSIFKEEIEQELEMFADLFAQTIVYGSFSAWIKFCQKERESNRIFSIDIVGDYLPFGSFLRDLFLNLKNKTPKEFQNIFKEMENRFQNTDFKPVINNSETLITTFYSDFLNLYDPKTAKDRGVVYTPYEIVHFIVEGVDFLLKRWFDKPDGILTSSEIKNKNSNSLTAHKLAELKQTKLSDTLTAIPTDRLRILDPAAGTMAFASGLLHVAREKLYQKHKNQPGLAQSEFQKWVRQEFFENMYAFEILMAPYVLGHIRTFLTLQDLGLNLNAEEFNLKSYLMNTLMSPPENRTLDEWKFYNNDIGNEIKEAMRIRDQRDIFVIMGNPPYNLSSQNDCKWINDKINDYKEGLQERNKKILSDDYVKFLRFAQWKIQKVGRGIVAFITNSRYLDGQMFSVMRKSLKSTFDHIYIVNLHGDYRKKETGNPFDIKVGVSIAFMLRLDNSPNKNGAIHYMDLKAPSKEEKFAVLAQGFNEANFKLLPPTPKDFFIDIDTTYLDRYQSFIPIDKLFRARPISGIMAGKDQLVIDTQEENLQQNMKAFFGYQDHLLDKWKIRYNDTKSWQREKVIEKTSLQASLGSIKTMLYRGWDFRYIVYDRSILEGHRMGYIDQIATDNPAITVSKSSRKKHFCTAMISNQLIEKCFMSVTDTAYAFLYKYNDKPNLIKPPVSYEMSYRELFDYIYAILQCEAYRNRYDELLRKSFPRIPFPVDRLTFEKIASLGRELSDLHLLSIDIDPKLETNDIPADQWKIGDFFYNKKTQTLYFDSSEEIKTMSTPNNTNHLTIPWIRGISPEVWDFEFGSIPQLEQFLKSRQYSQERKKNTLQRALSYEELVYFLKMVSAIKKTIQILPKLNQIYKKMDYIEE